MELTGTFTGLNQVSGSLALKRGQRYSFRIGYALGGAAWIEVEKSPNLKTWKLLPRGSYNYTFFSGPGDFQRIYLTAGEDAHYRLRLTNYGAGSFTYALRDDPVIIDQVQNEAGEVVWQATSEGIEIPSKPLLFTGGSSSGEVAQGHGTDIEEGYVTKIYDETVDLTGAGAVFKNVFSQLPQYALIRSVQCYITEQITSDTGRVKVGIGPSTDPDKYGLTPDDDQESVANSAIFPDGSTVLAAATQLRVNGCQTDGTIAVENFTDGAVRVRAVVEQLLNLHEAIINFP